MSDLSKFRGAAAIRGIVLTGSDPYFVSGTDVALIFKTDSPKNLLAYLREHLEKACRASEKPVPIATGERSGMTTITARDVERRISSFIGSAEDAVILANSPVQLETILATGRSERRYLGLMPEYVYFRMKYRRPDEKEAAFLVLSDATIRRWCGPRWRIKSSRRIRAAAGLAALQADHLAEIVSGKSPGGASAGLHVHNPRRESRRGTDHEAGGPLGDIRDAGISDTDRRDSA